jgi:hypothetical protein
VLHVPEFAKFNFQETILVKQQELCHNHLNKIFFLLFITKNNCSCFTCKYIVVFWNSRQKRTPQKIWGTDSNENIKNEGLKKAHPKKVTPK